MATPPTSETPRWLDRAENVTIVYRAVWAVCIALLLIEPLIDKHGEVSVEDWFGFHGLFGFVACVALVIAAKWLRTILKRPEDYYDR